MENNILSITKNKLKSPLRHENIAIQDEIDSNAGCFSCNNCALCKNYLIETKTVSSSKTNQNFHIKSHITCLTNNVVYMITDKVCQDVFYIGYTCDNMRMRWANHKSHLKKGVKSCEIAIQFAKLANTVHKIDRSCHKLFTSQLSEHISIVLIESVESIPGCNMKPVLEEREKYWQGALKASKLFGGINKRVNR